MKAILRVLNQISKNPVVNPYVEMDDRDTVVGHDDDISNTELKVTRTYQRSETSGNPEMSVSVYVRGLKVYGYNSEYLTLTDIKDLNSEFFRIQSIIDAKRTEKRLEAKNYFKSHFEY